MLKLPKGLKKKKKDKKSKKNQELFTEEELAAYKLREQREKQAVAAEAVEHQIASGSSGSTDNQTANATAQAGDEDEWKKFNALTTGVDSILKKTQGNLDRIKESSFFQRVAPKPTPNLLLGSRGSLQERLMTHQNN